MDILIDWKPYSFKFKGAEVTCELRRLKAEAFVKLAPYLKLAGEKDVVKITISMFEMQQLVPVLFPEHVRNLQGVTVNGKELTTEQLAEEAVLAELVFDIVGELVKTSRLLEADAKNLKGQSGAGIGAETPPLK